MRDTYCAFRQKLDQNDKGYTDVLIKKSCEKSVFVSVSIFFLVDQVELFNNASTLSGRRYVTN